uniref:tRNA pseudouridine synthase n=1 Tax=Ascaris lumbricoides TaxID=6252 RepID=A0A0M3IEY7_ASCLU
MSLARRYLLWISYDGSRFPEMAKGGSGYGVLDFLTTILRSSFPNVGERLKSSAASRTDRGVHALRNAIIIQVPLEYGILDQRKDTLLAEWNSIAEQCKPKALQILDFHTVSPGFSARRNVSYRCYKYRVCVALTSDAWQRFKEKPSLMHYAERDYAWILPPGFDLYKAQQACSIFKGTHNMASFFKHRERDRRKENEYPSAIRHMRHVAITGGEPRCIDDADHAFYDFSIISTSFLREQVRRMIGIIVAHAYGRVSRELIEWLLKNPYPTNFFTRRLLIAPAQGLFLENVVYDNRMFTNPIPYHIHTWDNELIAN